MNALATPESTVFDFLVSQGLAVGGEVLSCRPLAGGVSSDIWKVDLPGRSLCVKSALAQLKTSARWTAPLSRNDYEWAWMQFAARHCPDNVPRPLAHDGRFGMFAMPYLPPETYPVWKAQLMAGDVSLETSRAVGQLVGHLHRVSANRAEIAAQFDTTGNFHALRIEPYLLATADRHPAAATQLVNLARCTAETRLALVHGDVSPKNILVGPDGPVLLDAECAWFGDPAFDLSFCLTHLLLKSVLRPDRSKALLSAFDALAEAYFAQVDWEPRAGLEVRVARLLPALLLARIDGRSPVEYLVQDRQRSFVREIAIALLLSPAMQLSSIANSWRPE